MKTRKQLEQLAVDIHNYISADDPGEAIRLLDELYGEGMKDAGDIAETVLEKEEYAYQYALNVSCKPRMAILEAIKNKLKFIP